MEFTKFSREQYKDFLSDPQKKAFRLSLKIGRQIQDDFPNIGNEYINGKTLAELVSDHNLVNKYSVSVKVAEAAVLIAIKGFTPKPGLEELVGFAGLITDPHLLEAVGKRHITDSAKKIGARMRDEKRGVFSLSLEAQKEIGKRSGKALYENRLGVHARPMEERMEYIKKAVLARGVRLFTDDEKKAILELSTNPDYQNSTRSKINAEKIARKINSDYHEGKEIMKPLQVTKFIQDRKRRLKNKT